MQIVVCEKCKGSGVSGKCDNCLGSGEHECIDCGTYHTCSWCGGSGDEECEDCKGTGKVELAEGAGEESPCDNCGLRPAAVFFKDKALCSLCEAASVAGVDLSAVTV